MQESDKYCGHCNSERPLVWLQTKQGRNAGRWFLKCEPCDKFICFEEDMHSSRNVRRAGGAGTPGRGGGGPPGPMQQLTGNKRPWSGNPGADPNTPTRPRVGPQQGSQPPWTGSNTPGSRLGQTPGQSYQRGPSQLMSPPGSTGSKGGRFRVRLSVEKMPMKANQPDGLWHWRVVAMTPGYNEDYVTVVKSMDWQVAHQSWVPERKVWTFDPNAQGAVLSTLLQAGFGLDCADGTIHVSTPPSGLPGWSVVIKFADCGEVGADGAPCFSVQADGYREVVRDTMRQLGGSTRKEDDLTYRTWFPMTEIETVMTELRQRGFSLTCPDGSYDVRDAEEVEEAMLQEVEARMEVGGHPGSGAAGPSRAAAPPTPPPAISDQERDGALARIMSVVPDELWAKLYEFQREGVTFMVAKEGRALLADDMGLGKTVQALITFLAFTPDSWPLLVVCPPALRTIWHAALKTWLPDHLRLAAEDVWVIRSGADLRKHSDVPQGKPHVCITTYDLVQKMEGREREYKFIICDESHALKSRDALRTKFMSGVVRQAQHAILITGTPIMSRPIEAWSQVDMLVPGLLGDYMTYGYKHCFNEAGTGRTSGNQPDFRGANHLDELHHLLTQHIMLRRRKAEVAQQLPAKITTRVPLQLDSSKVNKAMAQLEMAQLAVDADPGNQTLQDERKRLLNEAVHVVGRAKVPEAMEFIKSLLDNDHKLLLFAHHLDVLDACQEWLDKAGVGFRRIDGQTKDTDRETAVRLFQTDEQVRVALLGITAAGAGLTLTAAQACVFVELVWNPSQLRQAEDRAHRIGQTEPVNCYYLTAEATTDDMMWKSLQRKLRVVGETLDGGGNVCYVSPRVKQEQQQGQTQGGGDGSRPAAGDRSQPRASGVRDSPVEVVELGIDDDDDGVNVGGEGRGGGGRSSSGGGGGGGGGQPIRHQVVTLDDSDDDDRGDDGVEVRVASQSQEQGRSRSGGVQMSRGASRQLFTDDGEHADGEGDGGGRDGGNHNYSNRSGDGQGSHNSRGGGDGVGVGRRGQRSHNLSGNATGGGDVVNGGGGSHGGSQAALARVKAAVGEVAQMALTGVGGGSAGPSQSSQGSQGDPTRVMGSMLEMVQSVLAASRDPSIPAEARDSAIVQALVQATMETTIKYSQGLSQAPGSP